MLVVRSAGVSSAGEEGIHLQVQGDKREVE